MTCGCGLTAATVVPVPMCTECARAYYVVLVSMATSGRLLELDEERQHRVACALEDDEVAS